MLFSEILLGISLDPKVHTHIHNRQQIPETKLTTEKYTESPSAYICADGVNTMIPRQDGRHFPDAILKWNFSWMKTY